MIMTNKLLPVALVAALIGGSVGAFVMHSKNQTAATRQMPNVMRNALRNLFSRSQFMGAAQAS